MLLRDPIGHNAGGDMEGRDESAASAGGLPPIDPLEPTMGGGQAASQRRRRTDGNGHRVAIVNAVLLILLVALLASSNENIFGGLLPSKGGPLVHVQEPHDFHAPHHEQHVNEGPRVPHAPAGKSLPFYLHHGRDFNETFRWCRDRPEAAAAAAREEKHGAAAEALARLPARCDRTKFVVPVGEGGLNNAIQRIWDVLIRSNRSGSPRTILLPYLRNHPARFKPAADLGPSRLITLTEAGFDAEQFCSMLTELGLCVLCRHSPDNDEDKWLSGIPPGHKFTENLKDEPDRLVLFPGGLGQKVDNSLFYWFLRSLVPNARVQQAVDHVRGIIGSEEYLAAHMRIEADWRAFKYGKFYVNASEIVREITATEWYGKLVGQHRGVGDGLLPVFVATGFKEEAKAVWGGTPKSKGQVRVVTNDGEWLTGLSWAARSLVDLEIAKDAEIFVGTAMFSTFSTNIFFFRHEEAICEAIAHAESAAVRAHLKVRSYAYHSLKEWGLGQLLECRNMCWGKEKL